MYYRNIIHKYYQKNRQFSEKSLYINEKNDIFLCIPELRICGFPDKIFALITKY